MSPKCRCNLGSLDAKDEFEALEKKWEYWTAEAKAQPKPIREVKEASAKNVGSALDLVLEEVKHGYERIKNQRNSE